MAIFSEVVNRSRPRTIDQLQPPPTQYARGAADQLAALPADIQQLIIEPIDLFYKRDVSNFG